MCLCIHIYIYMCMRVSLSLPLSLSLYIYIYVYVFIIYIYMYIRVYIHIYIYIYIWTSTKRELFETDRSHRSRQPRRAISRAQSYQGLGLIFQTEPLGGRSLHTRSRHRRNHRGCSVEFPNGLWLAFSNNCSLFSGNVQRNVTFPVEFYWKCPMDFQWHSPMGFHFCELWRVIFRPEHWWLWALGLFARFGIIEFEYNTYTNIMLVTLNG